jgi:hypothetical protein
MMIHFHDGESINSETLFENFRICAPGSIDPRLFIFCATVCQEAKIYIQVEAKVNQAFPRSTQEILKNDRGHEKGLKNGGFSLQAKFARRAVGLATTYFKMRPNGMGQIGTRKSL